MLSFSKDAKKYKTNRLSSERVNRYLQTNYKAAAISTIGN